MGRNDAPVFSRSDRPSMFGKRTEDVRTRLAGYTKEKLSELWRSLGYRTEAEFLAELIEIRVHGLEHVNKLHADRLRAVAVQRMGGLAGSGHLAPRHRIGARPAFVYLQVAAARARGADGAGRINHAAPDARRAGGRLRHVAAVDRGHQQAGCDRRVADPVPAAWLWPRVGWLRVPRFIAGRPEEIGGGAVSRCGCVGKSKV